MTIHHHLRISSCVLFASSAALLLQPGRGYADVGDRVWTVPSPGTFFSMQLTNQPPMPFLPFDVPLYSLGQIEGYSAYAYDDRSINYLASMRYRTSTSEDGPPGLGDTDGDPDPGVPPGPAPYDYGTNGLWLELTDVITNNVFITAHNTLDWWFQLYSRTNLVQPDWKTEQQFFTPAYDTLDLSPVTNYALADSFYWAAQSKVLVSIFAETNAVRPYPSVQGAFLIRREHVNTDYEPPLTVFFTISGTATNGIDYTLTNSSITMPPFASDTEIRIDALSSSVTTNRSLTLTLVRTNDYLVNSNAPSATILIEANVFCLVGNFTNPVGIDYHELSNSLIVAVGEDATNHHNFRQINTNGVATNWSGVDDLSQGFSLAVVRTNPLQFSNTFLVGETYFDNGQGGIGKISSDGASFNEFWLSLYGSGFGTLYFDRSGSFGGDLIASTGGDSGLGAVGKVWRFTSSGGSTLVADLGVSLGGLITLTNDPARWGPWAGKIITGSGDEQILENPVLYAISTNGDYETFPLNIQTEHMSLIVTNQDFYACDADDGKIFKMSRSAFTSHIGDLLITEEGWRASGRPPALHIVHWNAATTNFIIQRIDVPSNITHFEDATFAPVDLPCLSQ